MVIADMMDIKNILKDFSRLAEARKNHTFRTRLVFIFCAATIAMVLFFSYRVVNSAMDKILVVNEGGELLRFKAIEFIVGTVKQDPGETLGLFMVEMKPSGSTKP